MAKRWLRELFPPTILDSLAMIFTLVMIPVAYLYGVFYIAPTIWPTHTDELRAANGSAYALHVVIMTLLLVHGLASLWWTVSVDSSCRAVSLPVVAQPGWNFCPYCQHFAPPRAHHCSSCTRCILRQDHHCFFSGKCVGHLNHRYFLSFLLCVSVAGLYAVVLSLRTLALMVGGAWWQVVPALMFPVLMWMLQMVPASPPVMMLTSLAIFVTLGAGALLGLQLAQLWHGQTFWEFRHKVLRYDQGLLGNVREVLGVRWWLALVLPLVPSPLPGNGTHYPPLDPTPPSNHLDGATPTPKLSLGGRGRKQV